MVSGSWRKTERKTLAKVKPIFSKVFPKTPIVKTDSKYAEMVKYVTNCFLATKVSFANEIYQICEEKHIINTYFCEYEIKFRTILN